MTRADRLVDVVHATGNANSREVLRALAEVEELRRYWTTVGFGRDSDAKGPPGLLARRAYPMVEDRFIDRHPVREVVRNLLIKSPARRLAVTTGPFGIQWVVRGLDAHVARRLTHETSAVYGFHEQCTRIAERARDLGVPLVLEVQHAHWKYFQRVVDLERERSPEWVSTLPTTRDFARVAPLQDLELGHAARVIVPSTQVRVSVEQSGAFEGASDVVPYGCPPVDGEMRPRASAQRRPLRVLYVGRLAATKGIADLATVASQLRGAIELTIIGSGRTDLPAAQRLLSQARYLGSVGRGRVLQEMRSSDLLISPSLVEGRSLAVLEALSCGLPAVITPGSGVDDLVSRGAGAVVPIASPGDLISAVTAVIDGQVSLEEWSDNAIRLARENSWDTFREGVRAVITDVKRASE